MHLNMTDRIEIPSPRVPTMIRREVKTIRMIISLNEIQFKCKTLFDYKNKFIYVVDTAMIIQFSQQ